jgi:hypothetical protein
VEEKEYELILKYRPKYNREAGFTRLNKFKAKSTGMYLIDKKHAEEEMAKLLTEIEEKKEVDDIVTVFKRRL